MKYRAGITGALFGVLLGVAGHGLTDWRFWLLMVAFAVLGHVGKA